MSAEYLTASVSAAAVSGAGYEHRVGRLDVMELPSGVIHAYVDGSPRTVCGLPLAGLRTWPEIQYPVLAYPNKCEQCETLADPIVVNTRWRNTYLAA